MDYKILYIEDSSPDSIISEFKKQGLEVSHYDPNTFEQTLEATSDVDALVLDFRLTSGSAKFDAPTVAQTVRVKESTFFKEIPIILMSSEANITGYYEDSTSQDLFDFAIEKEIFRKNSKLYTKRLKGYISAYKLVKEKRFNILEILDITGDFYRELDYRIDNTLNHIDIKNDVHAVVRFIDNELIQRTGILIDEDVLSARLGIDKESEDWDDLLKVLFEYGAEHRGILSDIYPRWWMSKINNYIKETLKIETSFRRLTAEERVTIIKEKTELDNLKPISLPKFSKSPKYWNVCVVTKQALDPYDGLEIYRGEGFSWQDAEYISIETGLDPTSKGKHALKYKKMLKPFSLDKLKNIAQKINDGGIG